MYSDKVIIKKREVINPITDSMIPLDFCQKRKTNQFYYWWHDIQIWSIYKEHTGCTISNWKQNNRMASSDLWIPGWRRYTLIRWFLFMGTVVVSIFQLTVNRFSYWKCLTHVEVRTKQNDIQIWHFAFICAPIKKSDFYNYDKLIKITCKCCNRFVRC